MTATPSRRHVLLAAPALPLVACTARRAPAPADPDAGVRRAAAEREQALLSAYDALLAATPALAPRLAGVRAEHAAHLALLVRPGTAAPTPSAPPSEAVTPASLAALERAAAAAHAEAAVTAGRELAASLASLSASEASHVVALA